MFKMVPLVYLCFCLRFLVVTSTILDRWNDNQFVIIQNKLFVENGSPFFFYGSGSFWVNMLDEDSELDATFSNIAGAGIKVVRAWAFNDVSAKPAAGVYFQILQDGKATINDGPDGLQQLDKVVASAEKFGIKLIFTLTNNWNPERPLPPTAIGRRNNDGSPRGLTFDDYGGMDAYVRAFHPQGTHDLFYTDPTIIQAFKNYISSVVPHFANSPTILAWELANDPRCSSTLPASSSCNPQTITKWVADIAGFVKQLDPNHLVTAGDGGFYCLGCPKLYAPSNAKAKRDFSPTGPAFDGSFGVDTEDIIAIPCIDFGSFQLFPDQVQYFTDTPANHTIANIGVGNAWATRHSDTATSSGKPEVLTAFAIDQTSLTPSQSEFTLGAFITTGYNGNIGGLIEFNTVPQNVKIVKRDTNYPDISQLGAALLASKT